MNHNKQDYQKMTSESMIKNVLGVFQQIDKVESVPKTYIFDLVKMFNADPKSFQTAFQIAYLKIFKIFHQKANRKMPQKYEQLANLFFQQILQKHESNLASDQLCNFLQMLSEGVYSLISGIRITTARMLFHLIKMGNNNIKGQAKKKILASIFHLVRQKVSTYRQIGIKLASLILNWEDDVRDKIEQQLFKILAVQENEQIRKMTIINLMIKPNNIDRVLIRLRDKCPEIRSIIIRKLIGQKYPLENMTIKQRFHLLYDGFGNKDIIIQQQALKYFTKYFQSQPQKQRFAQFLQLFNPNVLLLYPHLYTLFDNLIGSIIQEIPITNISDITNRITNQMKQLSKNGLLNGKSYKEIMWLKKIGQSQSGQLKIIFQECVPSGLELSKILFQLYKGKDIFTIYQCLQLFSLQKSADEIGRNKMFDSLKRIVIDLEYFQFQIKWESLQLDDICPPITQEMLKQKKMMISYFDMPIISNSYDLIFEISQAMKALWPDHYQIQLKQIMAQWNNPEENTILVEKELTLANIRKIQSSSDQRLIQSLRMKLLNIEEQLMRQDFKTRLIILSLNRLRTNMNIDDFMPIIKQDLAKKDQSQGLILLGLYCIQGLDRIQTFLPLYWMHLTSQNFYKLHRLVSLKVITDFAVKFDLSKLQYNKGSPNQFTYSHLIKKILELVIQKDPDIRILAIEGLCRITYHGRVDNNLLGSCFMRLLLLWWETSSEEISARSVHTISIFVKQYIQRGNTQIHKLAQCLCIFFQVLLKQQSERKVINKKKITYNLKMQEFVKRSIVIAMTVLKYHKQSRQVIWKYQQSGAELGPQELFILYLYKQINLHHSIQKAINICDFYEDAPLQTLILIKQRTSKFLEQQNFSNNKKLDYVLRKMDDEIKGKIQIKNQQSINQELLKGLQKQISSYFFLIENQAKKLCEELQDCQIFIINKQNVENVEKVEDEDGESLKDDQINQEQIDAVIQLIQNAVVSQSPQQKGKKQKKNNLSRISEGNEFQSQQKEVMEKKKQSSRIKKLNPEAPIDQKRKRAPNLPSQINNQQQRKESIHIRTRSRHRI